MDDTDDTTPTRFTRTVDLAARRLGGMVMDATDEFFARKENLLEPGRPVYDAAAYYDRGKVMDGWETRRRRDEDTDSCTVRLGVPGVIETAVVDTTNFRGNAPDACWFDGCDVGEAGTPDTDTDWFPLLARTPLLPHARQTLDLDRVARVTHVRFGIVPDGGVARLRLLGRPLPDLRDAVDARDRVDLAATIHGGRAIACSDEFFSSPHNLVMVGDARDMSDGWETRRRRGPGEDWAIVELATTGTIDRIELDTTNFKGNHPDHCIVEAVHAVDESVVDLPPDRWVPLVPASRMRPHARHVFRVAEIGPVSHLRLRVIPDGGVARLRAYGTIDDDGWRRHGLARLDAAPDEQAHADLLACCGSSAWAREVARRRPFRDQAELIRAADEVWAGLDTGDYLEAFAAHPRIGERSDDRWSTEEQAGTSSADRGILDELEEGNRAYEARFGHVFLICATGLSADEMVTALRRRLDNDPDTELRIAADEQRRITHLRLDRLLLHGRR